MGLRTKDDAPAQFRRVVLYLRFAGWRMKFAKFDVDSVFARSPSFTDMLSSLDIHPTFSAPYVHSQIGQVIWVPRKFELVDNPGDLPFFSVDPKVSWKMRIRRSRLYLENLWLS